MLIKKSQELIKLSQRGITLHELAKNIDGFRSREQLISQAVGEIFILNNTLKLFRQHRIIAFDFSSKVETILEMVGNTKVNFQASPEWILDNKNFNGKKFQSEIDSLKNLLKQQLLLAWRNYLLRRLPSTNQDFLDLLSRIDAFKITVKNIKNLSALIKRDEFPRTQEEFDNTEYLIHQLEAAWDSLNASEVSESVLVFLKASASPQGAPLNLLTLEVQDWITKHKVSEELRIRLI
ncbi:hypothetical protein [Aliterella atlantica]|uniref:Uncharacterized protein n=1 Tax=Aliterella atlantica CENA595 TaxID=1618023 RepID=A0A0D8ZUQ0_9CYAN|nr:hypothetical protein [Aliterella atlantica]KJH72503.1 hypothetical protein UH38_07020 [Aliterella atlantica CENA595]